jgi:hypothetical protein
MEIGPIGRELQSLEPATPAAVLAEMSIVPQLIEQAPPIRCSTRL